MRLFMGPERQLLIDLADEYPAMRGDFLAKLEADSMRRRVAERDLRDRQYTEWRVGQVRKIEGRRMWAARLGPPQTVLAAIALCRVAWLIIHGEGGNLTGLVLWGLLALWGAGMWLGRGDPLNLPPTAEEIAEKVAG